MAKFNGLIEFSGKVGNLVGRKTRAGYTLSKYQPKPYNNRTLPIQSQRVRMGNLINLWRTLAGINDNLFEGAPDGQSEYNQFIAANLLMGVPSIYLTKSLYKSGASVLQAYQLSNGQLNEVLLNTAVGGKLRTNIPLGELELDDQTTIAQFSDAVVNNSNGEFQYGDRIIAYIFTQVTVGEREIPKINTRASFVQLSSTDSRKLYDVVIPSAFGNIDGFVGTLSAITGGIAYIHSRRSADSKILVSPSYINLSSNPPAATVTYSSDEAKLAAINSYGGYKSLFVAPSRQ